MSFAYKWRQCPEGYCQACSLCLECLCSRCPMMFYKICFCFFVFLGLGCVYSISDLQQLWHQKAISPLLQRRDTRVLDARQPHLYTHHSHCYYGSSVQTNVGHLHPFIRSSCCSYPLRVFTVSSAFVPSGKSLCSLKALNESNPIFKGLVHPYMRTLSLITHTHAIPNP